MSDFDISGVLRIDTTDLDKMVSNVGSASKRVAAGLAAAFAVDKIKDWGLAGLKAAADYEQSEIAFTSLIGSADKAKTFMQDMRDFVVKTPFEFPGLADAARKLLGYGFAAKSVIPIMTDIGNAASALGVSEAGVNGFVRALGQMQGKGKVSADEIRQISENMPGFNAAATIAAAKGISVAQTYKLMEQGAIPAAEGIDAILKGLKAFPGAAGAMDRQNMTLIGSWNMLKETVRFAAVDVFKPYMPFITGVLRGFAKAIGTTIVPATTKVSAVLFSFAQSVVRTVSPAFRTMAKAWDAFVGGLQNPFAVNNVKGLEGAFITLGASFGRVLDAIGKAFEVAKGYVNGFITDFSTGFNNADEVIGAVDGPVMQLGSSLHGIMEVGQEAWKSLVKGAEDFATGLKHPHDVIRGVDGRMTVLGANIGKALGTAKEKFGEFKDGLKGGPTDEDFGPFYKLGAAVQHMGDTIDKQGPKIIGFWNKELKPALLEVGGFIADNIIPILGGLSAAFAAIKIIGFISAIGSVLTALASAGGIIGIFGGALAALTSPITLIVGAIAALAAGAIYAYQHFEGFRNVVDSVVKYVGEQFQHFLAFVQEVWPQIQEAIGHAMNVISDVVMFVIDVVKEAWRLFGDDILKIVSGAWEMIRSAIDFAVNTIANTIRFVLAVINGDWGKAWSALGNIVKGAWDHVISLMEGALKIFSGVFGAAYEMIKGAIKNFGEMIIDSFKTVLGIHSPSKVFLDLGNQIIQGLIDGIEAMGSKVFGAIKGIAEKLPQLVKDVLGIKSPSKVFEDLGKQIPAGMAKGIVGGAGAVASALDSLTTVPSLSYNNGAVASLGAGGNGGNTYVINNTIHATDGDSVRGVIPELITAIRAGVGKN